MKNKTIRPRRSREERGANYEVQVMLQIKEYVKNGSKGDLDLSGTPIKSIPKELTFVGGNINLSNCENLTSIGDNLEVGGYLYLPYCKNLTSLGNNLKVGGNLDLSVCGNLTSIGDNLEVGGDLNLFNCENLTFLGDNLKVGGNLNLWGCKNITSISDNIEVSGNLYLNGCRNLTSLPSDIQVGGDVYLSEPPLANKTEEEIRQMCPGIKGKIIGLITKYIESFSRFINLKWKKL